MKSPDQQSVKNLPPAIAGAPSPGGRIADPSAVPRSNGWPAPTLLAAVMGASILAVSASADDAMPAPAAQPPRLPFTISRETTHITEPLRADGTPDYAAALEAAASAGVTPENNAAVLYWRALGPRDIDRTDRARFFAKLGIDIPPDEGEYLVDLRTVLRDLRRKERGDAVLDPAAFARTDQRELDQLYERMDHLMTHPWSAKDEPVYAEWIRRNEKPLAMIAEGTRRPKYYQPLLIPSENKAGSLIEVLLPGVQQLREGGRLLVIRAMLRLGEGKGEKAEADLLACHRLARHVASGTLLIERLVAGVIERQALGGGAALAHHGGLTVEQARRYRERLAELPRLAPVADIIDRSERYFFLDIVNYVALGGDATRFIQYIVLIGMSRPKPAIRIPEPILRLGRQLAAKTVEWDIPLALANEHYDQLVEAGRAATPAERMNAVAELARRQQAEGQAAARSEAVRPPDDSFARTTPDGRSPCGGDFLR